MVYRIFVEKKAGLANEAASLLSEIKNLLKISKLSTAKTNAVLFCVFAQKS